MASLCKLALTIACSKVVCYRKHRHRRYEFIMFGALNKLNKNKYEHAELKLTYFAVFFMKWMNQIMWSLKDNSVVLLDCI